MVVTLVPLPHHVLHVLVPERLISRPPVPDIVQRHLRRLIPRPALISLLRRPVALPAPQRALHPLVLVRALLVPEPAPGGTVAVPLDLVAAPAAAARAEEPEETGGQGEEDAEPDGHVDAVAEGAVDVVFGQRVVEGARQGGVEDGGGEGECDEEEGADGRHDGRCEAAEAGEESEDADEDLGDGADERDEVGDEHPFRNDLVRVQAIAQLFAEELVDAGVVEVPYLHRVEPKLVLMRRAVGDVVRHAAAAVGLEIPRAVVPQADMVEILDAERRFGDGGRVVEYLVRQGVGGEVQQRGVDVDVGGVGSEEEEVVVEVVVLVRTSKTDDDQADERGDRQGHGHEDAGKAARLPHDGGCGGLTEVGVRSWKERGLLLLVHYWSFEEETTV